MKRLIKIALLAGVAAAVLGSTRIIAQPGGGGGGFGGGGGQFDPAQFQQMMMDNFKEQLAVTDETEWKVISAAIQKVLDARNALGTQGRGFMGMGGRRGGGGGGGGQDAAGGGGGGRRGGGRGGMFGGTPLPEQTALQTALEGNASADELKAKLAALRSARQTKQVALDKAMDDLKKLLNTKQEAVAYTMNLVR